jgi:SSS family solute:Na+ symporter
VVIAWIALGWSASFLGGAGIYEIIPGFIASFLAIVLVSLATRDQGEFRAVGQK